MKTQSLADCLSRRITKWPEESEEYQQHIGALIDMLIETGSPLTLIDNPAFRHMMMIMDNKFKLPGSVKVQQLLMRRYEKGKDTLKSILYKCRKISICLDGWTAKGLTSSYLGITACFYDPISSQSRHALLNLYLLPHPHTGLAISDALEKCLNEWNIKFEKVMLVVSDNGANMVKAVTILCDKNNTAKENELIEIESDADETNVDNDTCMKYDDTGFDSDNDEDMSDDELSLPELPENVYYRWMPCMAHTLQLVIKQVYKKGYNSLIMKTRKVVGHMRKSSVVSEHLVSRCGKNVIADCTTRWNSTYVMAHRMLQVKSHVNEVLSINGIDTLLASEWTKLEEMANLLQPFAVQTDMLQTDSMSIAYVIPSILELECHLQQFNTKVVKSMLADLKNRFDTILNPLNQKFNPLPAAACLLDHTVAHIILSVDMQHLVEAAKLYILNQVLNCQSSVIQSETVHSTETAACLDTLPPAAKRFKLLSEKILRKCNDTNSTKSSNPLASVQTELSQYIKEVIVSPADQGVVQFWSSRQSFFPLLSPLALDLLAAPASQAYVERIFSLCGLLTGGQRNRLKKNLEMRVFLKLNKKVMK